MKHFRGSGLEHSEDFVRLAVLQGFLNKKTYEAWGRDLSEDLVGGPQGSSMTIKECISAALVKRTELLQTDQHLHFQECSQERAIQQEPQQ